MIGQVKKYAEQTPVRFHTPGHKGVFDPLDLTELFFTDNLYAPDENIGLILNLEERAAQVFFPQNNIKSNISCGGATLCIQAALLAVLRENKINRKKHIICARDCHVSFINAMALLDIEPIWAYHDFKGIFSQNADKNIIAAFVTSPNYYGGMRDIAHLAQACRKYSVPLIVDNAHGAHLAFYQRGGLHPINCGADIAIDSVHKTLPALTGAAIVHADPKYDIRGAMQTFASTSPSYLILQSVEKMLDFLESSGRAEHCRLLQDIIKLKGGAPAYFQPVGAAVPRTPQSDPFRIILNCKNSGEQLYYFLFERNITCEFYENDRVIIIPSVFNKSSDFESLASALKIFRANFKGAQCAPLPHYSAPVRAISLNEAVKSPRELVRTGAARDRICAEPIFAYPPGLPVILPGEIIDGEFLDVIKNLRDKIYVTADKN